MNYDVLDASSVYVFVRHGPIVLTFSRFFKQRLLTEGKGSVPLTSLYKLVSISLVCNT